MEVNTKELTIEDYGRLLSSEINSRLKDGTILEVYNIKKEDHSDHAYLSQLAHIKRFLELWAADSELRELVKSGDALPEKYQFNFDIHDLRSLWDENAPYEIPPLLALQYKMFHIEKVAFRNHMRNNSEGSLPEYNRWRTIQMNRCNMELNELTASSIVHAPFCIELCSGCSVGCWFCGISAPKLDDIFAYTEENSELYKEVLHALKGVFGEAAGKGFCYWATDPLDNPDYEKFMLDFHTILGTFPQTTTALPLKDVNRTKRLLELSHELNGRRDRFSILSLRQLLKVFEEFTAEELLFVEMVTQNKEAHGTKSKSGRATEASVKRISEKKNETGNQVADGTIACVSGFLISMVDRSVKLISPCQANERWPLGYIVFDEGRFNSGEEFNELIQNMFSEQMKLNLDLNTEMNFLPNLNYQEHEDGFSLSSEYLKKSFRSNECFKEIGPFIARGSLKVDDIMEQVAQNSEYLPAETLFALNQIYNEGVIQMIK
ncbi:MAG: radical SAM family RiPP maturation amino acid epimerase [Crocinitomicaceae bacterium]